LIVDFINDFSTASNLEQKKKTLTGRHGRSVRRAGFPTRYLEGTFVVAKAVRRAGAQG